MTYEDVRVFHRAVPFAPFTVHMKDGRSVTIDEPLFASWTRDRRRFVFNDVGAHFLYLPLDAMARIEPASAGAAA